MYNDDYTPMVFVIYILIDVFNKSEQLAKKLTLDIHNSNCKTVGLYSYDIAMTKKIQTDNISRRNGYPLKITIEEVIQNES